jgi:hypothetical protein
VVRQKPIPARGFWRKSQGAIGHCGDKARPARDRRPIDSRGRICVWGIMGWNGPQSGDVGRWRDCGSWIDKIPSNRYIDCVTVKWETPKMPVSRNCHNCGTRFTTSSTKRLFCSDRCKVRYHRAHSLTCFYCGDLADSKDHILPQAFGNGAGETVLSCRDCNTRMNAFGPLSIDQRVSRLIESLTKKHQLDRPIPEWDDEELEELGYSLRQRIKAKLHQRQNAIERVIHIRKRLNEIRRLTR